MVPKLLIEALVLVGSLASTDFTILDHSYSFLPDGSTSEGVGIYHVDLTPEYLGQDAPIDDYSVSLWYKLTTNPSLDPMFQITNSS